MTISATYLGVGYDLHSSLDQCQSAPPQPLSYCIDRFPIAIVVSQRRSVLFNPEKGAKRLLRSLTLCASNLGNPLNLSSSLRCSICARRNSPGASASILACAGSECSRYASVGLSGSLLSASSTCPSRDGFLGS